MTKEQYSYKTRQKFYFHQPNQAQVNQQPALMENLLLLLLIHHH